MRASVYTVAKVNSLDAIRLENGWLSVSILPDVGARIHDFLWKPRGATSSGTTLASFRKATD